MGTTNKTINTKKNFIVNCSMAFANLMKKTINAKKTFTFHFSLFTFHLLKIFTFHLILCLISIKSYAACQADINMGGNRIGNLSGPADSHNAVTRSYVDGLLSPIQVYWLGGDPKLRTVDNSGAITFSTTTTANYLVSTEQTSLVRGFYNTCVTGTLNDTVSVTCPSGSAFFYNISGIQFKRNFSFQIEIKMEVPTTSSIFFHLKARQVPGSGTQFTNGNFVINMKPSQTPSLFCNYLTSGSTSYTPPNTSWSPYSNPFYDYGENALSLASISVSNALWSDSTSAGLFPYRKIRIDYIEVNEADNTGTGTYGNNILPASGIHPYAIIVFWIGAEQIKAFRVKLARNPTEGNTYFYPPNLGNYIGIYNAGSQIHIKNIAIDSTMIVDQE